MEKIVFPNFPDGITIVTDQNDTECYTAYQALEDDFGSGAIHPVVLKMNLARLLNELIEPVRKHFREDPKAAKLLVDIRAFS